MKHTTFLWPIKKIMLIKLNKKKITQAQYFRIFAKIKI